jgi:hypothetical protein
MCKYAQTTTIYNYKIFTFKFSKTGSLYNITLGNIHWNL